ncbi:hypothetical protein STM14_1288 [Salmonella enterica subsp. enterica serovar Typhimurium str. 14028S]|uniref:Uncharacterized protein n=1 Tax=Salmonella typhimurium (strain 14028s / SGSC 2262) TaxID=588858 RepID=A0A0F6AZV3_SALT1|nr:hypothetical protein STM14_1288 [Salmonella enterica subsp. enterica serovar Typhimurium str. 14028S]
MRSSSVYFYLPIIQTIRYSDQVIVFVNLNDGNHEM